MAVDGVRLFGVLARRSPAETVSDISYFFSICYSQYAHSRIPSRFIPSPPEPTTEIHPIIKAVIQDTDIPLLPIIRRSSYASILLHFTTESKSDETLGDRSAYLHTIMALLELDSVTRWTEDIFWVSTRVLLIIVQCSLFELIFSLWSRSSLVTVFGSN